MAVKRTIELESITFANEKRGDRTERIARVLWRIATPGGDHEFTIPMAFLVNDAVPEEAMVANAKAALHALTRDLAEQTKPWYPKE